MGPVAGSGDSVVGGASGGAPLPLVVNEHFNQLDKIASQSNSQSILLNCGPVAASSGGEYACSQNNTSGPSTLPNCGPGVASSGGELSNSQIHIASGDNGVSNLSESNVSNLSESNVSNLGENNVGNGNGDGDGDNKVNCYGSIISPDDAPFGPSDDDPSLYFEMSESSGLKRSIIDVSSDESSDDDIEEPLLSALLSAEAPQNISGSKSGPKSKAKRSVAGDPSSDSIEEISLSASPGPQVPNVKNGGSRSAKK